MRIVFFFKQKTAYEMRISDWSSDVCSSDLPERRVRRRPRDGDGPARRLHRERARSGRSDAPRALRRELGNGGAPPERARRDLRHHPADRAGGSGDGGCAGRSRGVAPDQPDERRDRLIGPARPTDEEGSIPVQPPFAHEISMSAVLPLQRAAVSRVIDARPSLCAPDLRVETTAAEFKGEISMFTRFRSMPATAMAAVLGCALMATAAPASAQKKEKPQKGGT